MSRSAISSTVTLHPRWRAANRPSFGAPPADAGNSSYGTGALHIPAQPAPIPQPNFLFEEGYDESFRRSWGERLTYHVGAAYLAGLLGGFAPSAFEDDGVLALQALALVAVALLAGLF